MPLSAQQLAAQKNLSYVLAEKLAQRILKGEYEPGTILPGEIELGEQFGVSRTAVREAVKTLTAKGMVLPRPRIGTRVMPQSNWNFLDQELLTVDDRRELSSGHRSLSGYAYLSGAASLPTGSNGWHRGTESASQYVNGRNGGIKENFRRERWIEVDMAGMSISMK